jgi:hypothetical protein
MFCSGCGTKGEGKFCWNCGLPLHGEAGVAATSITRDLEDRGTTDWSAEVRYEALIGHPAVRDLIAGQGALAVKPLSGEALLKIFDKLSLSVVSFETIGEIGRPLWTRLGVKSAVKTRTDTIARPCGHVIVAALCSLARNSQTLTGVDQAPEGCTLHAEQPSDVRSFQGEVKLTLTRQGAFTRVEAGAWSKGQFYDWGKSNACLERLIGDLRELSVRV